ncbi:MAG: glyceraldehyde-3-phosphate dehydrogenase [Ectothiorhodospiraceae bacterium]|nr:glyceraldehyde-3-phosphate dehydrogenase [Ectothiorhodospiraceae bacterium]
MSVRVAINGLGRVGRATLKILQEHSGFELVAVNDVASPDDLAYLLQYDSFYGRYHEHVGHEGETLVIGETRCKALGQEDPARLPWAELDVELVFDCTGRFTRREELQKHLDAGARRVLLSAPAKGNDVPFVVYGVNEAADDEQIISCASCTTNCIAPVIEVVGRRIGLRKAIMTTIHSYTVSQPLVDVPAKKRRRGRAGAINFVPTSTGAAQATTRALPQYEGRFDGVAVRAPVPVGSMEDITVLTERCTSGEEINGIFEEEAASARYQGILGVTRDAIVSSDIIQDPRASIVDLSLTQVVDGDLVKVMSWYDNEWGYAAQMVRLAQRIVG